MKYLLLLALIACNPHIYQQSAPPPGRSARLDSVDGFWGVKRYRLEISQGVALALTCEQGGPCEKTRVVSDNPAIAEVRPASLSALEAVGYGYASPQQPSSAFVVIGKAPGTTKLHLTAKKGHRDIDVTIVAPPQGAKVVSSTTGSTDSTSNTSASLP